MSSLDELVAHENPNSISVLMPTERAGRQVQQNAIRFKNLVNDVAEQLDFEGADAVLNPLRALQNDNEFWQHQTEGLAVYACSGEMTKVKLPRSVEPTVYINDNFFVVPLAIQYAQQSEAQVLSLTWDQARTFRLTGESLEEIDDDKFPVTMSDVVLAPDREVQIQNRSHREGGADTAMFHGHGAGEESKENDRRHFFNEVGMRIEKVLASSGLPLVLVATEEVAGAFSKWTDCEPSARVAGSSAQMDDNELFRLIESHISRDALKTTDEDKLREKLGTAMANKLACSGIESVLSAAFTGRVEQLLIAGEPRIWGVWDAGNAHVDHHQEGVGSELINAAVIQTLRAGGSIVPYSENELEGTSVAAMLRY